MPFGTFHLEKNSGKEKKRSSLKILKKVLKDSTERINNEYDLTNKLKDKSNNSNDNVNRDVNGNLYSYIYKNPFSKLSTNSDSNLTNSKEEMNLDKNLPFGNYDYDIGLKKVKSYENNANNINIKLNGGDLKDMRELNSYANQQNFSNKSIYMDEKIKNIFNNQRKKITIKISNKTIIENDIIIEEDPNNNEDENK
jgi:hypothetical protein